MYDDVPICALIEYRFGENNRWLLSNISQSRYAVYSVFDLYFIFVLYIEHFAGSLEMYRSSKFQQWRDLLLDGGGKCKVNFCVLQCTLELNLL